MKRKHLFILLTCLVVCVFLLIGIISSLQIEVTCYTVCDASIPGSFDGFRIAQISDLHNREFGKDNRALLTLLESEAPDMIVVTGDLIDSYRTDPEVSCAFMERAVKIAPCYYVCGNHELRMPGEYAALKKRLTACGVTVLEDQYQTLTKDGESIVLAGLVDRRKLSTNQVSQLTGSDSYSILLSHRPEHFSIYREGGADLIFSGHAHGGQIRLPLLGAIFAPGLGFFPKYADGVHTVHNATMVISRGLGNSSLPFRLYCAPELVIVRLQHEIPGAD